MGLSAYHRKRDFEKTPEPKGAKKSARRREPIFVVQKHAASRLHYDFRLEHDGVLWSWAVPKGPSLNPADKRLAIHVEDHPVGYAAFEGTIPKGEYGGGVVMLWDRGTWVPPDDPNGALRKGKLTFTLSGERLGGEWTLARLRGKDGDSDEREQWLLIKSDDGAASRGGAVTDEFKTSVSTGRSMDEIAAGTSGSKLRTKGAAKKRTTLSRKKVGSGARRKSGRTNDPSRVPGAVKARLPRGLSPQLCTLADHVPEGDGWLHEIKFDGYRIMAMSEPSGITLKTRTGHDWTSKFDGIADALKDLPADSVIVDGEVTILDPAGHTSFQRLQNSIKRRDFEDLVYLAFDLLYLNGYDLTATPLIERKRLLRAIIPETDDSIIRYSDHIEGRGKQVAQRACELDLEGVICKRADAKYEQRRSPTWLKVKCTKRQEFVVIGWAPPSGTRKHFGSLLLGAHDARGRLCYTGRVGTGFTVESLREIRKRLARLVRQTCPADVPPEPDEQRGVSWVTPELVAEVEFTQWTDDRRLRHPSFQGLREDKDAKDVRIEVPKPVESLEMAAKKRAKAPARPRKKRAAMQGSGAKNGDSVEVAGVRLSSADRVLYPEQGTTKLDLARYYEEIADRILPYLVGRPLSTVRCPRGRTGECFFQKHLGETLGDPVRAIRVSEQDGEADYIAVDSVEGLITLVQFGVLELHPWGSTEDDLDAPDTLTFDLDPGEGVGFDRVKAAALEVRDALLEFDLVPFLKTTGGKGLHVVVPLEPGPKWDEAKAFCSLFAKGLAKERPEQFIATSSKVRRRGKIFIDYLRNSRGATSVAPYSTRARAGAPVAVPLRWEELRGLESSDRYDIDSVRRRVKQMKRDPWRDFRKSAMPLPMKAG